ncbi:hypothetical protein EGH24_09870 [Halonotius terrestris]|uniref:Uncharacterized protein n=1 Tax=Halonotius terrestris TaxID=2487750 RepID=A0A8J8P897_9EURY|nr:hypothetical protein [Halonotius terrestris]TQQ79794.1 hypothetical protein EGH24_09870 [Halonotius terrestris]
MSDSVEAAVNVISLIVAGVVIFSIYTTITGGDPSPFINLVSSILPNIIVGALIAVIIVTVIESVAD